MRVVHADSGQPWNSKTLISAFDRVERQITALHVEQTALAMATNLGICLD
jgi:hypothetical protein